MSSGAAAGNVPSGYKQYSKFTPQQMNIFNKLLGGVKGGVGPGLDYLSKLASGDESAFEQLEAPAYAGFQKNLGSIANRFSQFGAQDSSGFQNAVSGAGAELAQNLQSQRMGIQNDAIDRLLGHSHKLLGYEPYGLQEEGGIDWGKLLGQLGPAALKMLPQLIGLFAGGPGGAALGGLAGQAAGGIAKGFLG